MNITSQIKQFVSQNTFPLLLIICGLLGLFSAYHITIDKFSLLEDPMFVPSCSINPIFSCQNVMTSEQANAFGFPNPILGLIGFSAVIVVGFTLLAGGKMKAWYWRLFNLGSLFGIVFCHWLIYQAIYNIGSLCLWCIVVWAVTWMIFLYTTLYNVRQKYWKPTGTLKKVLAFIDLNSLGILFAWYVVIISLILEHFWFYWETVLPF